MNAELNGIIEFLFNANWRDDIISAIISTLLALGISWRFFIKSNRVAFYNDILHPIAIYKENKDNRKEVLKLISDKKNLYIYRYATKKEDWAISEYEESLNNALCNTFEKAFVDSIMNFFYRKYDIEPTHERWIEETGEHVVETNFQNIDNLEKAIAEYAYFYDENEFAKEEIEEDLKAFYENQVRGGKIMKNIFENTTIDHILYSSSEYDKYKKAEENLVKAIKEIQKLDKK